MARKILLADDSVTAQNMGRKILADAGYEVIAVNNGSAALKKIAELKPELVILDVYMPGYSGLEVCQRLKESPETARIPVLLTVGKLEPFKPEEAQRVRAEGYIVKPFEASELLSVLSKLEDKVVPRPEPSKSGRFARAMAAADELGRGSGAEPSSSETGWKSRIAFPHQKTESEQKEAERLEEQPSTYNPVNRDLRTVVEKFEEKIEAKKKVDDPEPVVDVAALAQAGLPKDVSPEELAAITAAAAQLQMAGAEEPQASERNSAASEKTSQESDASQVSPAASEPPAVEIIHRRRKDDRPLEETQKETRQDEAEVEAVTMAIATESAVASRSGASRWTAVSVALEGDEAAISLEHEMQKAYAASTVDSVAVTSVPAADPAPIENFSAPPMPVEAPVAEVSSPESETAVQLETVPDTHSAETDLSPVAQSEPPTEASSFVAAEPVNSYQPVAANEQPEAAVVEPVVSDVEPSQEHSEISAAVEPTSQLQDSTAPTVDNNVAEADAPVPASWDSSGAKAEPVTASSSFAPIDRDPQPEPQLDPEAVKSTAAAWASWRQIRDTSNESEGAESQPTESNAPDSTPAEMNAKAVAAGAEQIDHPAAATDASQNPADVASIVDSVLAGLRPKLMEEISRKMAEKK